MSSLKSRLPLHRFPRLLAAVYESERLYHSLPSTAFYIDPKVSQRQPDPTYDPTTAIPDLLSRCSSLSHLTQVHAHIIVTGFLQHFPASFQWNNIIRVYTRLDVPVKALISYICMSRVNVLPDFYTLPIVLKAACQIFAVRFGRQLHSVAVRLGLESQEFCESGFISLYAKTGEFEDARKVFDINRDKKLGSWNAMIGGLSQAGRAREAIDMFLRLRKSGLVPDGVTMVTATSACGTLGSFDLALQLHKCVLQAKSAPKSDILMMNSLIDTYGKCGRMDLANKVFLGMPEKNVSSWTSMIVGYAMQGKVSRALELFQGMREARVRPNHVTFVGVLSACVHGGRVQEGKQHFDMMKNVYGIQPTLQHYGCMADLLGRTGLLKEARRMVEEEMPMKANVVIWGCLLGACEKHGDVEVGEWVAKHLHELEPENDGVYVVLSNIYADRGMWADVERVRFLMKQRKLEKTPGYSLATKTADQS